MNDTILYAREWVKMMWDMDVIDHNVFESLDEAMESLVSYLKGEEHDSHMYAAK